MDNKNHTLFTILNKINSVLILTDFNTDEIIFINKKAREHFGDITGKQCWKSFYPNNTKRCKDCTSKNEINNKINSVKIINFISNSTTFLKTTSSIVKLDNDKEVRLITIDETINDSTIDKLLFSEQRFKALSDASFEAILILKEGFILEANESAYEMFGYEKSSLRKKFASIIIAPEARDAAKEKMLTGYEEPYESIGITKDRQRINLEIRGKMIKYRGEEVRVTAIRNISQRKKAESHLFDSEQRFKSLSNASFEAILILKDGYIIEANRTAYKIFGYKPGELKGIFASLIIAPEEREEAKKKMLTGYEKHYESVGITKNNNKINIEIRGKMIKYMGKNVRVTAIRNISKRKRAETALIESEKKFRNLFESTPDPIIIYVDGIIKKVNKTCIYFFDAKSEAEIVGHSLIELIHPYYQEDIKKRIKKITQLNGIAELTEEKIITLTNVVKDVEMIGVPIIYEEKIGIQVFFRDITKRIENQEALKKSEKKLKHLNATKDKFFSIIAHDLRNPFNQLLSFTELIYENIYEYSFEELKEYIGLLNKSARNGFNLLENLLEWARSQSGKKEYNPQNFNFVWLRNSRRDRIAIIRVTRTSTLNLNR